LSRHFREDVLRDAVPQYERPRSGSAAAHVGRGAGSD
jgi:hypothetical protein